MRARLTCFTCYSRCVECQACRTLNICKTTKVLVAPIATRDISAQAVVSPLRRHCLTAPNNIFSPAVPIGDNDWIEVQAAGWLHSFVQDIPRDGRCKRKKRFAGHGRHSKDKQLTWADFDRTTQSEIYLQLGFYSVTSLFVMARPCLYPYSYSLHVPTGPP